jgi:hypothetical protein
MKGADILDRLVSQAEAARHFGISKSNLKRRRQLGLPPRFLKIGNRVFYRIKDLQEFIEACVKPLREDAA